MRTISLETYEFYFDIWETHSGITICVKFKPKQMNDPVKWLKYETKKEKDMPAWQQSLLHMMKLSYEKKDNKLTERAQQSCAVLKELKRLGIYE